VEFCYYESTISKNDLCGGASMSQAFFSLFNQILVLFFLMVAGYAAKKTDILNQQTIRGISMLILNMTLPALIISSMQFPFSRELLNTSLQVVLISVITYSVLIVFSYGYAFLSKIESKKKDVLQFSIIFANVSFMGFPIISVLYGEQGIFYAALFNIPFQILLVTLGVVVITRNSDRTSGKMNFKKALKSPGLIAVLLGFAFFLLPVSIPDPIFQSLQMIGGTTTPLSMLLIGGMLAEVSFSSVFGDRALYLLAVVRLFLLPMLVFVPLKLIGLEGMLLAIPVIIIAMPVATLTGAFARLYDSDYHFASKAIFITTMCSLFTIPLWAMLF
jgi:malate permease and related proteins